MGLVKSTNVRFSDLYNYGFNFTSIYNAEPNLAAFVGDIRPDKTVSSLAVLRYGAMRKSGDTSVNSFTIGDEWKASNTIDTALADGAISQGTYETNHYGYSADAAAGTYGYGTRWNPNGIAADQLSENTVAVTHNGASVTVDKIGYDSGDQLFELWLKSTSASFSGHTDIIGSFSVTTSEVGTTGAPSGLPALFYRCVTFPQSLASVALIGATTFYLRYTWTESDVGTTQWNEMLSIWDGSGGNLLVSFNDCSST
jgi:hypothetical protein